MSISIVKKFGDLLTTRHCLRSCVGLFSFFISHIEGRIRCFLRRRLQKLKSRSASQRSRGFTWRVKKKRKKWRMKDDLNWLSWVFYGELSPTKTFFNHKRWKNRFTHGRNCNGSSRRLVSEKISFRQPTVPRNVLFCLCSLAAHAGVPDFLSFVRTVGGGAQRLTVHTLTLL